ncbi:hypothetical protein [Rhodoferax sp.]|uniref:hypothetical protein n=1 Tax=Rhodoferax sp. TaxID=50421 RepID=UPI00274612B6|nr:hypothetical protein [Rhodoferax sp.]
MSRSQANPRPIMQALRWRKALESAAPTSARPALVEGPGAAQGQHSASFDWAAVKAQLQAEWQDISAKLAKLQAEANRRQAEIATVGQTIAKLEATVPMAQTREADYQRLVNQGYISGHATQDKTRERIELERDLAAEFGAAGGE